MTESNTSSDIGQGESKKFSKQTHITVRGHNELRYLAPAETPRERMARVAKTVQKKQKRLPKSKKDWQR